MCDPQRSFYLPMAALPGDGRFDNKSSFCYEGIATDLGLYALHLWVDRHQRRHVSKIGQSAQLEMSLWVRFSDKNTPCSAISRITRKIAHELSLKCYKCFT